LLPDPGKKKFFQEGDNDFGAINYIVKTRQGDIIRMAMDGRAWLNGLERDLNCQYDFRRKNIVILGAGGAARELADILNNRGVSQVTFTDVSQPQIDSLHKVIKVLQVDYEASIIPSNSPDVPRRIREANMVINATGIGRGTTRDESPLTEGQSTFHNGQIVLDLISSGVTGDIERRQSKRR